MERDEYEEEAVARSDGVEDCEEGRLAFFACAMGLKGLLCDEADDRCEDDDDDLPLERLGANEELFDDRTEESGFDDTEDRDDAITFISAVSSKSSV